jgi:hypothetical protein
MNGRVVALRGDETSQRAWCPKMLTFAPALFEWTTSVRREFIAAT